VDRKKLPESKNFVDKTGYGKRDRLIDTLLGIANPVSAYRNIRGTMLENGWIDPPKRTIQYQLMRDKMPESKNFVDRTSPYNYPAHQDFIRGTSRDAGRNELFWHLLNAARRDGQIGPLDYMIEPAPSRKMIDPRKKNAPYL
jgi:hypothetical protein